MPATGQIRSNRSLGGAVLCALLGCYSFWPNAVTAGALATHRIMASHFFTAATRRRASLCNKLPVRRRRQCAIEAFCNSGSLVLCRLVD